MIIPSDRLDQVVRRYLEAVERALAGLHEERRRELLADLSDHIEAERAALDEPTEAAVRAILDRLGDPAVIAAEARLFEEKQTPPPFARLAPAPYPPAPYPVTPHPPQAGGRRGPGPLGWTLIAIGVIALLCFAIGAGAFVLFQASTQQGPLPVSTASQLDPTHS